MVPEEQFDLARQALGEEGDSEEEEEPISVKFPALSRNMAGGDAKRVRVQEVTAEESKDSSMN